LNAGRQDRAGGRTRGTAGRETIPRAPILLHRKRRLRPPGQHSCWRIRPRGP